MNNAERERAIHLLEYYGEKLGCKTEFDLAIKALEDRPTGKWDMISLLDGYANLRCSECGQSTRLVRDSKNEFCCIKEVRDKIVACPYCGADMKGGRE